MKKILSLALVLVFALSCFVACGGNGDDNTDKTYTLSIAVDDGFKTVSSKGKITNIALALVTDAEGKIVAARFDSVEASLKVTDGEIATADRLTTKVEKGANYTGMAAGSWADQAKAFELFLIGKTAAEVAGMKTVAATQGSVGYMISADADLLAAGCTIQIAGICAVVAQSATNAR